MAITMQELAGKLGLSVGTVSGALNGNPATSRQTRARVLKAARQFGYTPNKAARALIQNRSLTVGIILGIHAQSVAGPFYTDIITSLLTALSEADRDASILSLPVTRLPDARPDEAAREEARSKLLAAALGRLFNEAVVIGHTEDEYLEMLREMGVRVVYAGNYPLPAWTPRVEVDLTKATEALCDELAALGYRHVLHFGRDDTPEGSVTRGLCVGLRASCAARGLGFTVVNDEGDPRAIWSAARDLPPRSVIAPGNDRVAALTLCVLLGHGVQVPAQVGVAGFGNTPFSLSVTPALTTVDFHFGELGRRAAELLLSGVKEGTVVQLAPTVVRRESVRTWG